MLEALDVVVASATGCCVALGLRWLGVVAAPSLWRWLNEDGEVEAVVGAKCADCAAVSMPLSALGRCWDCYGRSIGYFKRSDDYVYDLAGNVMGIAGPPLGAGVMHRVATPIEHVEVAANKLTSVGFLAMSLRVSESAGLSEVEYDAVVSRVETAAARLTEELQLCRGCRRWGGIHDVRCGEVTEMVDMAGEAMMCRDEIEASPTETSTEAARRRHIEAED